MHEALEVPGIWMKTIQSVARANPQGVILSFNDRGYITVTDRILIGGSILVGEKVGISLRVDSCQPAIRGTNPQASLAVLIDGSDISIKCLFILQRGKALVPELTGCWIEAVKSAACADPEHIVAIDVELVDMIIRDGGRVRIIVKILYKLLGTGIITVHATQTRPDPQVSIFILDNGCNPAIT